jgi:hypothetical protein
MKQIGFQMLESGSEYALITTSFLCAVSEEWLECLGEFDSSRFVYRMS